MLSHRTYDVSEPEIRELRIRGFQSLADVVIPVGRFTAIVGQSNVGKSAVVRALNILAHNGPSTGYVRAGAAELEVTATLEDGSKIMVTRAPRKSEYKVTHPELGEKLFAKCGVTVPELVESFLKLSAVTFASQHDAPFMLSEPGSTTAVRLGELTNVSRVSEAVRLANRRRLDASQEQKARTRELDELVGELNDHKTLKERKIALAYCRTLLNQAAVQEKDVHTLANLIGDARAAGIAWKAASAEAVGHAGAMEAVTQAEMAAERWYKLREMERRFIELMKEMNDAEGIAATAQAKVVELDEQAHKVLEEAGVCPVCQRPL